MQQVLGRKNVQKTKFEAAEIILDSWNQETLCNLAQTVTQKCTSGYVELKSCCLLPLGILNNMGFY